MIINIGYVYKAPIPFVKKYEYNFKYKYIKLTTVAQTLNRYCRTSNTACPPSLRENRLVDEAHDFQLR